MAAWLEAATAAFITCFDDDDHIAHPVRTMMSCTWRHSGPQHRHLPDGVMRLGIDAIERHCVAFTSHVDPAETLESGWHGTWSMVSDVSAAVTFRYKGCNSSPVLIRHIFTHYGWLRAEFSYYASSSFTKLQRPTHTFHDDYVLTMRTLLLRSESGIEETELDTENKRVTLLDVQFLFPILENGTALRPSIRDTI